MKNNVWKKYRLSIQNSIDNHIKITYIKPNFASLNKKVNPYKACSYGLCRDFFRWRWVRFGYKNINLLEKNGKRIVLGRTL